MQFATLIPVFGVSVRDPRTYEYLPREGKRVALSTYWRRKIAQGDVRIMDDEGANDDDQF